MSSEICAYLPEGHVELMNGHLHLLTACKSHNGIIAGKCSRLRQVGHWVEREKRKMKTMISIVHVELSVAFQRGLVNPVTLWKSLKVYHYPVCSIIQSININTLQRKHVGAIQDLSQIRVMQSQFGKHGAFIQVQTKICTFISPSAVHLTA